jgi:general secretion pathway protein J
MARCAVPARVKRAELAPRDAREFGAVAPLCAAWTAPRAVPTDARAFTLLEVLLAVAVFSVVLAAINTVFFSALRLRNKTNEVFEKALPLNHALSLIKRDLEGIMLPGGRLSGSFSTSLDSMTNAPASTGERVTPDIYTAGGNVTELSVWADVVKVAYFLAPPTNHASVTGGKHLIRRVTRNLLPVNVEEPESQWLMEGVETMRLQYYDGMSWIDTWDSSVSTNLPRAVRVQLTLVQDRIGMRQRSAPIELIVPVFVENGTNSTEQTQGDAG